MPAALDLYGGGELRSETHFGVSDCGLSSDIVLWAVYVSEEVEGPLQQMFRGCKLGD